MQYINQIAGKGLAATVIFEMILTYFSFILMLAVPMSCLVASLFTAHRLKESKAFLVIQNAGVSYVQLVFPLILLGGLIAAGMWYMNSYFQPKSSLRSYTLMQDIKRKQPAFQLENNVFFSGIPNYGIRAKEVVQGRYLKDVVLFDNSLGGAAKTILTAKSATLESQGDVMMLKLKDGEFHQYKKTGTASYQRIRFRSYQTAFNIAGQQLQRSDIKTREGIKAKNDKELGVELDSIYQQKARFLKNVKGKVHTDLGFYEDRKNAILIERYKRQVYTVACVLFVLLGIPIGLSIKRGGLAIIGGIATAILTIYWSILVLGDKMIKNAVVKMDPFWAIWGTNFITIAVILWATAYYTYGRFWKFSFKQKR